MEHSATNQQQQLSDTNTMSNIKKPASLLYFLESKNIPIIKMKQHFLENCANIPQEARLPIWKVCLGISSQNDYAKTNEAFIEQYNYLKHVLDDVLQFKVKNQETHIFCIFLLDRDTLPLYESNVGFLFVIS
jgi:hypothetical protein